MNKYDKLVEQVLYCIESDGCDECELNGNVDCFNVLLGRCTEAIKELQEKAEVAE